MILDEFRKKNQWNRSSYEGDIDCARWPLINHVIELVDLHMTVGLELLDETANQENKKKNEGILTG